MHYNSGNVAKLLILGLAFHYIYIRTVFDCYFTNPIVHGMRSHSVKRAESRRLVLIIGDGLRADLLFNEDAFPTIPDAPKVVAPYLKSIAATRGAFGGIYEDVFAVTKGWSTDPVDFDSVFNRSSHTFSFGSPDILHMFSQGATPRRVKTWTYHKKYEDFTKDWSATFLDLWVLDRLTELFRNATTDATLDAQLRSDKVVFFLHLQGLDITGHMYRPHSREYMNNIRLVDSIVQQAETLINEFYNDQETSFVFTADHGMSAIGNHGDGEPHNTRTPLIAWGQGIRGPLPDSSPSSHDSYSKAWGLGHLFRRDIEQADLAALMASLLGIHWPVNSIGVLPDVDPTRPGYVSSKLGDKSLAQAALVNARAILEQYTTKHELKKARTLFYKPFWALKGFNTTDNKTHTITSLTEIEHLIQTKDWNASRLASAELIRTGLSGLHYLQTYDWLLIRGIVTIAYIGWAAYASLYVFRSSDSVGSQEVHGAVFVHATAALTLVGFWTSFALQHAPSTFYALVGLPIPQKLSFYKVLAGVGMAVAVLQVMVFLVYFLGFGPCFVILSNSVEGLFYVIYSSVLVAWVVVESIIRNGMKPMATESKSPKVYQFRPDDLRIALFFLFFVQVGFFGAGK
ncbi:hypothetical protein DXG01_004035 [Tephrocybe rancida]|nr:hypothetical protein DXG01_004035 [Tephrocybe rancida]